MPRAGCGEQGSRRSPCHGVLSEGHVVVLVVGHGAARGSGLPAGGNLGLLGAGRGLGAGSTAVLGMHPEPTGAEVGEATSCKGGGEGEALLETQQMRETHLRAGAAGICLLRALFSEGLARGEGRELCSDADPGAKVVPRPDFTSRHCRGKAWGLIDEELSSQRPCHPQG